MHRSTIAIFLILSIIFSSCAFVFADDASAEGSAVPVEESAAEGFSHIYAYEGQFLDVETTDWFYSHVAEAYEYGLVSGRSETSYDPDGNITVAECLVIASQLYSIYTGIPVDRELTEGEAWYQPYVDYAIENKIIWANFPYALNAAASRAVFAGIMANALPDEALAAIGSVKTIPDVNDSTRFSGSIYQLYNAGILGGADEYGTFHPYDTIKRSEVAVVVLNMADETRRKVAVLKDIPPVTLYADNGATMTVKQGKEGPYLKLGWSKSPVVIPAGASPETILNSATLNPMKTNNAELDSIIDNIFAKILTDDMSTYEKTRAIYLYLMDNCYYGWGAVSWSGKYVMHDDDYVVVMGKHILKTGHGTCDNYSAAFVAMARRIGLNAYFARGYAGNQSGVLDTHEIAIVTIAGVDYVFDPQIDDYNSR
ncbi:MAG: S-layer homology domain-containing protein, partial [Firmicutes bacterium]|nr:S-layer homology domain-containing protein [Bacillota bacterium]